MSEKKQLGGRIEEWMFINHSAGVVGVRGFVYSDPRGEFEDGELIRTSAVVAVNGGVLETRNTLYLLGKWKAPNGQNIA